MDVSQVAMTSSLGYLSYHWHREFQSWSLSGYFILKLPLSPDLDPSVGSHTPVNQGHNIGAWGNLLRGGGRGLYQGKHIL